jgi:hypothetical protein
VLCWYRYIVKAELPECGEELSSENKRLIFLKPNENYYVRLAYVIELNIFSGMISMTLVVSGAKAGCSSSVVSLAES